MPASYPSLRSDGLCGPAQDWADRFTSLVACAKALPVREVIIDGEFIVPGPNGLLQLELAAGRSQRLIFYAFDILYGDGYDLRQASLLTRKSALMQILDANLDGRTESADIQRL